EGLWLGATKGRPGEAYFVTDGEPVVFREFVTELLATQGVEAPDKEAPAAVARLGGAGREGVWGPPAPPPPPAGHPPDVLALGPGVHDRHLQGPQRARLRAGQDAR